jgi:methylmalonyl-CoA carboxyltransferase 12S subunit
MRILVAVETIDFRNGIDGLESAAGPGKPAENSATEESAAAVEPQAAPPAPALPELTEEQMLAISAALAAYLGVRVRIREIRLISSSAWAKQGRVSIQASHILH